jgi:hypothetical protein
MHASRPSSTVVRLGLLLACLAPLLGACEDAGEPGRFRVVFGWAEAPPDPLPALFAWARVEEREDLAVPGRILGTAGPEAFDANTILSFQDIPNGPNRVVVVELRDAEDLGANVLFYGLSQPFTLAPDHTAEVEVEVPLVPIPGASLGAGVAPVRVLVDSDAGVVGDPHVELALITDRAVRVRLSSQLSFPPEATQVLELASLAAYPDVPAGLTGRLTDWDLDPQTTCGAIDYCPRRVYARFVDAYGYESLTAYADAVVDQHAPEVLAGSVGLRLQPGPDNVLDTVAAVRQDTAILVSFSMSEPLVSPPRVSTSTPAILDFTLVSQAGLAFLFSLEVPAGDLPQGAYTVNVSATDLAGNAAESELALPAPGLVVDTTAPAAPDVDSPDRIVYSRVPWGAEESEGEPSFSITGEAGAAEPGAVLIATAAAQEDALELGRVTADADGAFSGEGGLELPDADRPEVFLAAADAAGNLSPAVRVRNIHWRMTLAEPLQGEAAPPASVEVRPVLGPSLLQALTWEVSEVGSLARADGNDVLQTRGSAPGFRRRDAPGGPAPMARLAPSLAYDSTRGTLLLFGGWMGNGLADTWELDASGWTEHCQVWTACPRPPARDSAGLAYDSLRQRLVLFGGRIFTDPETVYSDTWEWDGTAWSQVCGQGTECSGGPSARCDHAMAYDSRRGKVVMFGGALSCDGEDLAQPNAETWEWDGNRWNMVCGGLTGCSGPSARSGHGLVFDSSRGRVILAGGSGDSGPAADTWAWDGTAWTRECGPGTGCQAPDLGHVELAYVPARDRVVLRSGEYPQTWEWDGSAWTLVCIGLSCDPFDNNKLFAMAPGGELGEVMLLGGFSFVDSVWAWGAGRWTVSHQGSLVSAPKPQAQDYTALAFDEVRGALLLYGGRWYESSDAVHYYDGLWSWDGLGWEQVCGDPLACSGPQAAWAAGLAFDQARGVMVLQAGCLGDGSWPCTPLPETWEWDGAGWHLGCDGEAGCTAPAVVEGFSLAFDRARGLSVLVQGGQTWTWDGQAWTLACDVAAGCPGPSARTYAGLAMDEERGTLVLVGGGAGNVLLQDTWEWDGIGWDRRCDGSPATDTCPDRPSARFGSLLQYDSDRAKVVLFGGSNGSTALTDVWEWDGLRWTLACADDAVCDGLALFSRLTSGAYDRARRETVFFGSLSGPQETWAWRGGREERPGQVVSIRFADALEGSASPVPDPRDCLLRPDECPVESLGVRLVAGGQGDEDGVATPGVGLWAWSEGAWAELASGSAGAEEPGELLWQEARPEVLGRLFAGDDDSLHLAVVPLAPNGLASERAVVVSDYLEVTIDYRLP